MKTDYFDSIPEELKALDVFVLWKEFENQQGKKFKSPVSKSGSRIGYNDPEALFSFHSALDEISRTNDRCLGISLGDGLEIKSQDKVSYLWCLDFDGFAEFNSNQVDDGVGNFLRAFDSYTETSPSRTGFKVFFLTDREPQSKFKFEFGPSEFAKNHPQIRKYQHREIEVFSMNSFLALTADCFFGKAQSLEFVPHELLDERLAQLQAWGLKTLGETNEDESLQINQPFLSSDSQYSKLTAHSLETVLAFIDHFEEQTWSDVANALARVYGEEGREHFLA